MPSVASDPSVFSPSVSKAGSRSPSAPHDQSGGSNGDFAKLLDTAPVSDPEPPARPKRSESKTESKTDRHDDEPTVKGSRRHASAKQAKSQDDGADVNDAQRAETKEHAAKAASDQPKDAGETNTAASDATKADGEAANTDPTTETAALLDPADNATVTAPAATDTTTPAAAAPAITTTVTTVPVVTPADGTPAAEQAAAPVQPVANTPGAPADAAKAADASKAAPAVQPVKPQTSAANDTPAADAKSAPSKPAFAEMVQHRDVPARAEGSTGETQPAAERAPVTNKDAAADLTPRPHDNANAIKSSADLMQNLGIVAGTNTAPAQSSAAAHAAAAAAPTQAPVHQAVPVAGLAVEIAAQSLAGKNRFEIRLDPPELGRIDVRLEIDNEGHVKSRLIVERAETLDLLRRDAPQLERALQQAGLKTSDNALEFSLRDQTAQHEQNDRQNSNRVVVSDEGVATTTEVIHHNYGRLLGLGGGLDIRV